MSRKQNTPNSNKKYHTGNETQSVVENQNCSQNNDQNQNNDQSQNHITIPEESKKALEAIKRARALRSDFQTIGPGLTYRLEFDPSKSKIQTKTFNGQTTERIAHSVIDVNDRGTGQKILSLTFKQSLPIENAFEQGYTVMDLTRVGEGFNLRYEVEPIE